MNKSDILIGFLIGILANAAGIFLYILIFSERNIGPTLVHAANHDYLGKLIALGAVLNFFPFFIFLRKNLIYHARGVLLATMLTAVIIAITEIL